MVSAWIFEDGGAETYKTDKDAAYAELTEPPYCLLLKWRGNKI